MNLEIAFMFSFVITLLILFRRVNAETFTFAVQIKTNDLFRSKK
jgi:hypothetical protein